MGDEALKSAALGKVVLALIVLSAIILGEIVGMLIVSCVGFEEASLWALIIPELAGAAVAVGGMALLGGAPPLKLARDDTAYAFRFGWWSVAVGVMLFCLEMLGFLSDTPIHASWVQRTLECALFCLAVGVLEEHVFRGIIFNSLLALFGGTHRGVVRSVVATSILFGMAHIDVTEVVDAVTGAQAVLKIIQTGMYSVLLCVIVLRTRRLGGVSLFHAVDDFLILVPSIGLFGESPSTDYVVSGDEAAPTILFYVIVISLYLPFFVKSLRELRRGQDVYRGAFMPQAFQREGARTACMEQEGEVAAIPPAKPWTSDEQATMTSEDGFEQSERSTDLSSVAPAASAPSASDEAPRLPNQPYHHDRDTSLEAQHGQQRPPAPQGW